jgi:hypothetical protein
LGRTPAAGESDPAAFLFNRIKKPELSAFIPIDCEFDRTTLSNLTSYFGLWLYKKRNELGF